MIDAILKLIQDILAKFEQITAVDIVGYFREAFEKIGESLKKPEAE